MKKIIATITTAAFLNAVVVLPVSATSTMIDDSQKQVQTAQTEFQKMQEQQKKQEEAVKAGQATVQNTTTPQTSEVRQTIYDNTSGQMVTIVKNGYSISAYNSAGQQIPVQAEWVNQLNAGNTTSNMSGSTAQQLAVIASTIKTDEKLNTIGKIIKALLAMEAVKANNQLARAQYAKQLAQQKAQNQPTIKTTTQQKQKDSSAKGKGEIEYASVLRDGNQTGGTIGEVSIANQGVEKQSSETPLSVDLIGKIVGKDSNVLTIEDTTGKRVNVKVHDDSVYSEGEFINATGTVLSGSDGNIYVMSDPESGIDVQLNPISEETYNYKAAQQVQAAEQFSQEYPQADGIAGTGANGAYMAPAPADNETITEISGSDEALVPQIASQDSSSSNDSDDDSPGLLSQAGSWIMNHKSQIAGGAMVVAGGAMVIGSGALTLASGATLGPIAALQAKVGYSMISGGIGAIVLGTFNNYAEEQMEERHPNARNLELRQKGLELQNEVDFEMTEANQK